MKLFLKITLGVIVALVILGLGSCALTLFVANEAVEEVDKSIKEGEKETKNLDKELKGMLDKAKPEVKKDEWEYKVTYTLKNTTGKKIDYIEVEYDMIDKDGVKLGGSFTNITDIEPNEEFEIELDLYEDGTETYEISKITSSAW